MTRPLDRLPGFSATREIIRTSDGPVTVRVTAPAFMRQPPVDVTLTPEQYGRYLEWRSGKALIQEALPDLSPSQREMLMTGLSDDAFHNATRTED
jgi:hypothetical protein